MGCIASLVMLLNHSMVYNTATYYGVDPVYACEIVRLESEWNTRAVGDKGKAVGLWQWHLDSWVHVRVRMGESTEDLRLDPVESTVTAMYAIKVLGLERWWSTSAEAKENTKSLETGKMWRNE